MSSAVLRVYHRLPAPAQSAVASLRGRYLRWWRYGPITEELVLQALERDYWSADQWRSWQEERLAFVLERAARAVPYYRENWAARRRRGDRSSTALLENWPVLDKEDVRRNPRAFLADDSNPRWMFAEHTSGTTGKPLTLWWSRRTVQNWYALCEARLRHWNGVSRRDPWAILGGQLVQAASRQQPPFWVWNSAMRQLYLSSYHLAPRTVPSYLDALRRRQIKYLLGYTSSLYELAQAALAQETDYSAQVAITNAEPVFPHQRQVISRAFGCPVRETYGMAEIVAAASECAHGVLHQWPEVGYIEVLRDEDSTSGDGHLLCTGLLNTDMPLIRYRLGDRASLPGSSGVCKCGRALPVISCITGRVDDVLYTTDGRSIGRLDPVFKANLPIQEAQIVQETLSRICVRYVPAKNCSPDVEQSIATRLRDRMGEVDVTFETLERIPRDASGKFRPVICAIPEDARPRVARQTVGAGKVS